MVVSIPDIKMTGLCVKETVLGTNKYIKCFEE